MTRKLTRTSIGDEAGIGLMMVMGIGLLLMAMGVMGFSLLNIGQNSAKRHLTFEQAIHVAENGIDTALANVQASKGLNLTEDSSAGFDTDAAWNDPATTYSDGQIPTGTDTVAEETAWLEQRAAYAAANFAALKAAGAAGTSSEGDYAFVRPSNRKTVYAVGWVPSVTDPVHTRYIKTEWLFSTWNPSHALLVNGDLDLSADVAGLTGNVHANGDIDIAVNSTSVSGVLTTSGVFDATGGSLPDPPDIANVEEGAAQQDVPDFDPRTIWERGTSITQYRDAWYDMCPDGTIRRVDSGQSVPCAGPIADGFVDGVDYLGWGWKDTTNTWDYKSDDTSNGIFYAYQANIDVSGNPGQSTGFPWKASIVAEAIQGGPDGSCSVTREEGDIKVTGTPYSIPFMSGLGYIAGRDLKIHGNVEAGEGKYQGFYAAVEQISVFGNVSVKGSIVAQDECDSPSSTINDNHAQGSVTITYDGGLEVLVGATVRSTLWLEL